MGQSRLYVAPFGEYSETAMKGSFSAVAPTSMNQMSVAVCIPTYNQASYLQETVESVLRQTRPVQQIIISDDASTDDTAAVCVELAKRSPLIRSHRQPVNRGIAGNTDFAMRQASADLVVRVDSDDRLLPDYVARLAAALEAESSAGYAHCAVWEIDQEGRRGELRRLFRAPGLQPADDALRAAVSGYRVAANILMFRRSALAAVGYTTGRPDYVEDYHLSVALARAGWTNWYCDEPLAEYRVWMDVKRTRAGRKILELEGYRRVFEDQLSPGFSEQGWKVSPLVLARRRLAARHAGAFVENAFDEAGKKQIVAALERLGQGWRLSLRLGAIRLGLGYGLVRWERDLVRTKKWIKRSAFRQGLMKLVQRSHPN